MRPGRMGSEFWRRARIRCLRLWLLIQIALLAFPPWGLELDDGRLVRPSGWPHFSFLWATPPRWCNRIDSSLLATESIVLALIFVALLLSIRTQEVWERKLEETGPQRKIFSDEKP